jgi:hypothetical protein
VITLILPTSLYVFFTGFEYQKMALAPLFKKNLLIVRAQEVVKVTPINKKLDNDNLLIVSETMLVLLIR